jgi:hypothetical protein
MTKADTGQDQRQARWRNYFEQTLLGPDREVAAATEAAMHAVARGEGQAAIIAAGRAAAKAVRGPRGARQTYQSAHRQPPRQAPRAATAPPQQPQAAPSAGAGSTRPARIWPPNSAVVYMLEKRSEAMDGQFFQTWSFRLLRLEDGHRPVQPPIPVEVRGRSIIGQLAKGDVVEIPYGRAGQTRIVKTLRNLTTGCDIEAKGRPFRRARTLRRTFRMMVATVGATVLLAALAAGALAALYYAGWMH